LDIAFISQKLQHLFIIQIIKSMANIDIVDSHITRIEHIRFKRKGIPEQQLAVTIRPADG
jgi:hypothetical protein